MAHQENERESEIYAKIGNYPGLFQAAKIYHQEQAQIKTPTGRIRVRKERSDKAQQWRHTMTTKHMHKKEAGVKEATETTISINAEQFEMFKSVADTFMRKTRFLFPLEKLRLKNDGVDMEVEMDNVFYEVDVFVKDNGQYSSHCKIDLEHGPINAQLQAKGITKGTFDATLRISDLPFAPTSIFLDTGEQSGPMRELVSLLYATQFLRKTPAPT